uniref:ATP synthase gamma subunit n=1 Tax=Carsonella ruddii TaxID=114186 RepID=Q93UC2_CARRU|nr:ATP synthase gamma subunit [Candidatus Carsonella ruddii]
MINKEFKNKINIISNINKLTNTMSMIAMSKMNKINKYLIILNELYLESKDIFNLLKKKSISIIYCCIIITSNKGLCGNINNEILKKSLNFIKNNNCDIILIGKKSIDYFEKKNIFIKEKIIFKDNEKIKNIFFSNNIINNFKNYKNVYFFSSKYINNIIKIIQTKLFNNKKFIYYEIFNFNINNYIKKFYNNTLKKIFIEHTFCELKSRMITMKSAADNSKKLLKKMKIIKNKIRQFKVTQNMLEIINGFNL